MPGTKKRKHISEEQGENHASAQPSIKAFASVRKSGGVNDGAKKRKTIHEHEQAPAPDLAVNITTTFENKRKRALETCDQDADDECTDASNTVEGALQSTGDQRQIASLRRKRAKNTHSRTSIETPSKSAMAMFGKLKLGPNIDAISFAPHTKRDAYETPPTSPDIEKDLDSVLPAELEELTSLNAAFLSALAMYYAHNGTTSPAKIKALQPMITKHWKRRSVTVDDLCRLISIYGADSAFALEDFGRAGICVTKEQPRGRAVKRAASYVDEVDLNTRFEQALRELYSSWLVCTPKENQDPTVFLDQLPLVSIAKNESVEKAAPLFARGHQRLSDLKTSQEAAKADAIHPSKLTSEQQTTPSVQSRGTNLLDRILAKQAISGLLPAGPTREQLERKAALQRIEDVARVLDLLAAGRSRCSFGMQAMIQQLQQSLRNPISKDEVMTCLGLMAQEITPGFVSLVKNAGSTIVVVTKGGRIGLDELRQRVEAATA